MPTSQKRQQRINFWVKNVSRYVRHFRYLGFYNILLFGRRLWRIEKLRGSDRLTTKRARLVVFQELLNARCTRENMGKASKFVCQQSKQTETGRMANEPRSKTCL